MSCSNDSESGRTTPIPTSNSGSYQDPHCNSSRVKNQIGPARSKNESDRRNNNEHPSQRHPILKTTQRTIRAGIVKKMVATVPCIQKELVRRPRGVIRKNKERKDSQEVVVSVERCGITSGQQRAYPDCEHRHCQRQ